jgi:hypothetical protein
MSAFCSPPLIKKIIEHANTRTLNYYTHANFNCQAGNYLFTLLLRGLPAMLQMRGRVGIVTSLPSASVTRRYVLTGSDSLANSDADPFFGVLIFTAYKDKL